MADPLHMHFDLFYELSVPASSARSEHAVYDDTLAEIALADRLGFRTAWLVEHHFMPEYSHSSAPELVLAAAAQRTQRIRLGHAIIPLPYWHPLQVAERIATLDVLSGGRIEFGFGRGFSPREYEVFGVPMAQGRERVEESLEILRQSFTGAPVCFHGRHYRVDGVRVVPQPLQRPHPPLWSAAVSPESFTRAAELGVGVLAGPFKPWFMIKQDIRRYRSAWNARHRAGAEGAVNRRAGMTVGLLCLDDGQRARELAAPAVTWFYRRLLEHTRPVLERLYHGYEYYRRYGRLVGVLQRTVSLQALELLGLVIVGDPAHCVKRLRALQAAGVDHVLCAIGAGVVPSELVRESMQVLAREVMPRLQTGADPDAGVGYG